MEGQLGFHHWRVCGSLIAKLSQKLKIEDTKTFSFIGMAIII